MNAETTVKLYPDGFLNVFVLPMIYFVFVLKFKKNILSFRAKLYLLHVHDCIFDTYMCIYILKAAEL